MEIKSRNKLASIGGTTSVSGSTATTWNVSAEMQKQRTLSQDTEFPASRRALRSGLFRGTGAEWVFTHRDFGSGFITQESKVESSHNALHFAAGKGSILPIYNITHTGPALLADHALLSFYTDQEQSNAEQLLWTKGAEAIRIARPNKPTVNFAVTVGELRREGIPNLIGSLASRTRTVADLFRNGSKEYLNAQFGWAPLVRDLTNLLALIPNGRRVLEQYERDIDRLVRRRYHFPDQIDTNTSLSFDPANAAYRRQVGTPWGYPPEDHVSFRPTGQVPEQVNQTTVRTWFSGGFRFYHRSVPEALQELSLFEEKANLLLGTRLDPEILWNLAPWTWLLDWFINFGDVVSNASALLSDDLVMQYGYLMRTTHQTKTLTWPQGLWCRQPTGPLTSLWGKAPGFPGAYSQTTTLVTKQRGRASPFGFGPLDSVLTDNQLAILAALGMSRR